MTAANQNDMRYGLSDLKGKFLNKYYIDLLEDF